MDTNQLSRLVSLYYRGGPAANDVDVTDEQMDSDRSDYLDALHSLPPYSDMLEEPDYMCGPSRCRPSQCHPTHQGEDEDDSDWYEWAFGTPHSSDSNFGDEVVQFPPDQCTSVQQV